MFLSPLLVKPSALLMLITVIACNKPVLHSLPLSVCSKHNFQESPAKMLLRSHDPCDQNFLMALNFESKNKNFPIACSDLFDDPCYGFLFKFYSSLPTLFRTTGLLGIPQRHCKCKIVKMVQMLGKEACCSSKCQTFCYHRAQPFHF